MFNETAFNKDHVLKYIANKLLFRPLKMGRKFVFYFFIFFQGKLGSTNSNQMYQIEVLSVVIRTTLKNFKERFFYESGRNIVLAQQPASLVSQGFFLKKTVWFLLSNLVYELSYGLSHIQLGSQNIKCPFLLSLYVAPISLMSNALKCLFEEEKTKEDYFSSSRFFESKTN